MLAPACSRPTSSDRSATSRSGRHRPTRSSSQTFDHRRLADAGLAGEDQVVLPAPHQDVDDLADFSSRPTIGSSLPLRACSVRS
jgi:hypothetical protein